MDKEPSLIVGALSALISAIVGVLVAFGINVSDAQRDAILACVAAIVPFIFLVSAIIRQTVYSPDSVQKLVNTAEQAGATNSPAPPVVP